VQGGGPARRRRARPRSAARRRLSPRRGRADEALDNLERDVRAGYNHRAWMETDSDLDPIRRHPRFQALLKQIDERR
jgi:hypothetical protein